MSGTHSNTTDAPRLELSHATLVLRFMLFAPGLKFWMLLFGMMVSLIVIAVIFKSVTGVDLDPPEE